MYQTLGLAPLGWGRDWPRNTPSPTCYHTECGRSKSNRGCK